MSELYKCDRCKATVPLNSREGAVEWSTFVLRTPHPPGHRPLDPPTSGHLCVDCSVAFEGWVARGKL